VPSDKKLELICNTGVHSYKDQLPLDEMDIRDTYNLQGVLPLEKSSDNPLKVVSNGI